MTEPDHLYLVDDNEAFLESMAWLFEGEGYLVTACSDAREALDRITNSHSTPGQRCCLVLDIRMPKLSGLDLHDQLNRHAVSLPIVYLTGHADVPLAVKAMKKGAYTLLEKPLQPQTLLHTVECAMKSASPGATPAMTNESDAPQTDLPTTAQGPGPEQERTAITSPTPQSASIRSQAPASESTADAQFTLRLERLTPRERQVLECIVQGQANKVCANTLDISIRTVELHRSRLMKKLDVRTGPELIRKVLLHRASVADHREPAL